jgi:YD repeat-containing protein
VHAQGGTTLDEECLSTDAASELVGESDLAGYTAYRYDSTGQFTAADHSAQADESYAYDAAGNRSGATADAGDRVVNEGTYSILKSDHALGCLFVLTLLYSLPLYRRFFAHG